MDSEGFYGSPNTTHYGNGAAHSGAAFGANMNQNVMRTSQTTNGGVVGQNVMQQSQITNAHLFNSSGPNRFLQLQDHQQQQRSNALLEKGQASPEKVATEVEACVNRVTEYMFRLQKRPLINDIAFWRMFVGEFYAPYAKKRLCVSMYDAHKKSRVFPQESWHCEICNRRPCHGFEANAENLPRLFKIEFESDVMEDIMYIDKPNAYHNSSGHVVLDYGKAIQVSFFDQLRVMRYGKLRVVFTPELKICSWEFCARFHEELVPRRLLVPQIGAPGSTAQMYQATTAATASSSSSASLMHNSSNMLANSAGQLSDAFKTPLVNELGYSERYVRSLQIFEVANSMKDLIDQFWEVGTGPIESLSKYSRRETKRPLSDEPSKQNPNKEKLLDFPPALQLMRNSINDPYCASSTSTPTNTSEFFGHRDMMLLRSHSPRNTTNSPLAISHTTPSTPSSSMPPPRNY